WAWLSTARIPRIAANRPGSADSWETAGTRPTHTSNASDERARTPAMRMVERSGVLQPAQQLGQAGTLAGHEDADAVHLGGELRAGKKGAQAQRHGQEDLPQGR